MIFTFRISLKNGAVFPLFPACASGEEEISDLCERTLLHYIYKNTVLTSQRSERFLSQQAREERCLWELRRDPNSFTLEDSQPV